MGRSLKFDRTYFILAVLLFIVEVLIAVFVQDRVVRPYIGDLLVVILIYCFLKSFLNISSVKAAIAVLLFAYIVEILQYLHLIDRLGLGDSTLARIILGSSFEWLDMLAYSTGILLVLFAERFIARKRLT